MLKSSFRLLRRFVLFGIVWFVVHGLVVTAIGLYDSEQKADVAVILGTTVHPDGRIGEYLKTRLDQGLVVYRKGLVPKIIVSGQVGIEGVDESWHMKRYLVQHGAPESAVLCDSLGNNTWATAQNFRHFQKQHGFQSVLVVSQFFHIARIRLAFWQAGVSPVYATHATRYFSTDLYALAREFVGFYAYLLRMRA